MFGGAAPDAVLVHNKCVTYKIMNKLCCHDMKNELPHGVLQWTCFRLDTPELAVSAKRSLFSTNEWRSGPHRKIHPVSSCKWKQQLKLCFCYRFLTNQKTLSWSRVMPVLQMILQHFCWNYVKRSHQDVTLLMMLCWWWALEGSLRVLMIKSAVFLRRHKCIDWIGRAGLGRGWCWTSLSDLFSTVNVFVVFVGQGVITHCTAQEGHLTCLYKAIYTIINL